MTRLLITPGARVEALVDGRLAVEGTTLPVKRGDEPHPVRMAPTYVRGGLVAIDANDMLQVRPLPERDITSEDDVSEAHAEIRLNAREFSELWIDGRLVYMRGYSRES